MEKEQNQNIVIKNEQSVAESLSEKNVSDDADIASDVNSERASVDRRV